jgi:hypothetical protein
MMANVKTSMLASRVSAKTAGRWSGFYANPVGSGKVTRETAPLSANAPARVQNPKLNTTPWSTSFAQKRTPMKKSKSKGVAHG